MKKALTFLTLIIILSSCKKEKTFEVNTYPQKWELVKMSGNIPNSETTGNQMLWKETYVFNADYTFTKTRIKEGTTTSASGTFDTEKMGDEKYFVLQYTSSSDLIGSCNSTALKEQLFIKSSQEIYSTWQACDGPGLDYQRVQ